MADVFISYAREDRAHAEQVARGLGAMGVQVFWDTEIPPGQTWADYIEGKLAGCSAVIVLWSENSSKSQWVREEARMGRERGKLIPATVDASAPPFGFGEVQTADLSSWRGEPSHPDWVRLVEAVRTAMADAGRGSAMRASPTPAAPFSPPRQGQTKAGVNPLFIAGGLAVAAVLLGVVLFAGARNVAQPVDQPSYASASPTAPPLSQPVQQAPSAPAAPNYGGQVQERLVQATQVMAGDGFFPATPQPFSGSLANGQRASFPITLVTAGDYRLVGVCDRDCGDLDLLLKELDGRIVVQDQETDPNPVLSFRQFTPAQGYVEVVMYNCTVSPCFYSVMLYARQMGVQ